MRRNVGRSLPTCVVCRPNSLRKGIGNSAIIAEPDRQTNLAIQVASGVKDHAEIVYEFDVSIPDVLLPPPASIWVPEGVHQ